MSMKWEVESWGCWRSLADGLSVALFAKLRRTGGTGMKSWDMTLGHIKAREFHRTLNT